MSALVAQAVGMLETIPFAQWLVHAQDRQLTGTLVLEEPDGHRHGLYFDAGAPSRAKTASPVIRLGEVLVEQGELSPEHSAETLERARQRGLLHGQLLLAEGLVDSERLGEALREQLARQVVWLFGQPLRTKFGYFDEANLLSNWGAPPILPSDTRQLLWRGIREHARSFEIEQTVAQIAGVRVALRSDLPLAYFDFMAEGRAIVEMLRGRPQRIAELLVWASAPEAAIKRVLYFLVLSRSLDLGVPSAPPLGLAAVSAAPHVSPPAAARVPSFAEIQAQHAAAVASDSIPETVAPGRGTRPMSTAPPPTDAKTTESEPAKQDPGDRTTSAEIAFQRAEALLARGNFEAAEREATIALQRNPERPEYIALCAWLSATKPQPNPSRLAAEFNRALQFPGNIVKVRWYRGLVLKRLDRHADALREFRFVAVSDPLHVDAAREVRIYEARLRRSPKSRPSLAPSAPPKPFNLISWLRKRRGARTV